MNGQEAAPLLLLESKDEPPPLLVIEKGVAIPSKTKPCKYPWPQMKVGDSFLVNAPMPRMINASRAWGQRNKARFVVRQLDNGVRVWRVK